MNLILKSYGKLEAKNKIWCLLQLRADGSIKILSDIKPVCWRPLLYTVNVILNGFLINLNQLI